MGKKTNYRPEELINGVTIVHSNPAVLSKVYSTQMKPLSGNNKIITSMFCKVDNIPLGTVITTRFFKNGLEVANSATTYGSAVVKDTFTVLATHTVSNIDLYDAYRVDVQILNAVAVDPVVWLFVDDYFEDVENYLDVSNTPHTATVVPGASVAATNPIVTTIQLYDIAGVAIAAKTVVDVIVTTDATGDTPSALGVLALSADGKRLQVFTADTSAKFITDATGKLTVTMTKAAAGSLYVAALLPNGKRVVSSIITWT